MDTLTLNELSINTCSEICELNCKENIKRRLLDLGLINGTKITPVFICISTIFIGSYAIRFW